MAKTSTPHSRVCHVFYRFCLEICLDHGVSKSTVPPPIANGSAEGPWCLSHVITACGACFFSNLDLNKEPCSLCRLSNNGYQVSPLQWEPLHLQTPSPLFRIQLYLRGFCLETCLTKKPSSICFLDLHNSAKLQHPERMVPSIYALKIDTFYQHREAHRQDLEISCSKGIYCSGKQSRRPDRLDRKSL